MSQELQLLVATAAGIGVLHTVLGPDHYLPFAALAQARSWSRARTLAIVLGCGVGHVAGSVALGAVGIAAGAALSRLEAIEAFRGDLAAWLLIGFGLAYAAWGLRRALRDRPHSHWHSHVGGVVHQHGHSHHGEHLHVHDESASGAGRGGLRRTGMTPWVLFIVFVFGPCEALIPVLMVPAAQGSWWGVALVCLVFGAATLATMVATVGLTLAGLSRLDVIRLQRYSHVAAGVTVAACGFAMRLGL